MVEEKNKEVVRRYMEQIWNERRLDRIEQFFAEDFLHHDAPGATDRDSTKMVIGMILDAFPDFQITIADEIVEGDRVVTRQTISGTQQGELMGIPATGKRVDFSGISIFRLAGGKIVELWALSDNMGMMQQLGVLPPVGVAGD